MPCAPIKQEITLQLTRFRRQSFSKNKTKKKRRISFSIPSHKIVFEYLHTRSIYTTANSFGSYLTFAPRRFSHIRFCLRLYFNRTQFISRSFEFIRWSYYKFQKTSDCSSVRLNKYYIIVHISPEKLDQKWGFSRTTR